MINYVKKKLIKQSHLLNNEILRNKCNQAGKRKLSTESAETLLNKMKTQRPHVQGPAAY